MWPGKAIELYDSLVMPQKVQASYGHRDIRNHLARHRHVHNCRDRFWLPAGIRTWFVEAHCTMTTEPTMTRETLDHLRQWVIRQFGENRGPILVAMVAQYLLDPELYDNAGWWRCYDDAGLRA